MLCSHLPLFPALKSYTLLKRLLAIPTKHPQGGLLTAFAGLSVAAILGGVATEAWWLLGLPAVLLVVWLTAVDFRKVFFLMLAAVPLSTEVELPGGLSTDLVSEPLMWLLTLVSVPWFLRHYRSVDARFVRHPITLLLLAHLAWTVVCTAGSQDVVVSVKFLLAKGWYVVVFYFLASRMLRDERDYKTLVWCFFVPLFFIVPVVLWRHAALGFSFQDVERVMGPFFRNHVMYACMLAIFIPFAWYATYWYRRWSGMWWWLAGGIALFLVGINFAYTRAAYVALVAAVGIYWLMRRRLMKAALLGTVVIAGLFAGFVRSGDNWLEFAPDFERTVTHARFDNLLEATTKLEDISTMERVHRWVAATYMIRDRPLMGFGPGNFYFFYQKYTVTSFKTYVSRNPEHSGIHNYYLMTTVEQGLLGLLLFLTLCVYAILRGERIYHATLDAGRRRMLVAAVLCFILIDLLMLMNDFVETDKIGSLFFLSLAILVNTDLENSELSGIPPSPEATAGEND